MILYTFTLPELLAFIARVEANARANAQGFSCGRRHYLGVQLPKKETLT